MKLSRTIIGRFFFWAARSPPAAAQLVEAQRRARAQAQVSVETRLRGRSTNPRRPPTKWRRPKSGATKPTAIRSTTTEA